MSWAPEVWTVCVPDIHMNVTAAIVNYGTPQLTTQAVWSLRSLYPALPILVLDNASTDQSSRVLADLPTAVQPFRLIESSRNLHHGPGLDLLVRESTTNWVLAFDSDCLAYRKNFIEQMLYAGEKESAYMVGPVIYIDRYGYRPSSGEQPLHAYVHPHCALVRRSTYLNLPPFEKHGVPCLTNQLEASRRGEELIDFPVSDYVFHIGRGTVNQHGYRLGAKGWFYQLRHYARRIVSKIQRRQ